MILTVTKNRYEIDQKFLEKVAKAAFSFCQKTQGEIELIFTSEAKIRELNIKYRQIDRVTDVLSFKIAENPLIGQIFICYNRAREQAQELGKELDEELALLLVHGTLHIFDFDHENINDAQKMEETEKLILNKLGIKR